MPHKAWSINRPLRQIMHNYWNGWMSITASRNYHHIMINCGRKKSTKKVLIKKHSQLRSMQLHWHIAVGLQILQKDVFTCMQPLHQSSTYKTRSSGHWYSHLICLQQPVKRKWYLQGTRDKQIKKNPMFEQHTFWVWSELQQTRNLLVSHVLTIKIHKKALCEQKTKTRKLWREKKKKKKRRLLTEKGCGMWREGETEWVHEKAVAPKSSIDENDFGTVKLSQAQQKSLISECASCGVSESEVDKVCVYVFLWEPQQSKPHIRHPFFGLLRPS